MLSDNSRFLAGKRVKKKASTTPQNKQNAKTKLFGKILAEAEKPSRRRRYILSGAWATFLRSVKYTRFFHLLYFSSQSSNLFLLAFYLTIHALNFNAVAFFHLTYTIG